MLNLETDMGATFPYQQILIIPIFSRPPQNNISLLATNGLEEKGRWYEYS